MSDIDYLLWWQNIREMTGHRLDAVAWHLSDIGHWFESFFIPAVVYWAVDRKTGVFCNLARNMALVFTQFLKTSICAYRPWVRDARIVPIRDALPSATGFSFPSGHTVNVASVFGGLAMRWKNRVFRWSAVFFVVLIGLSRNFLGVHTPQDVLGGFAVAVFALLLVKKISGDLDRHPARERVYAGVGVAVGVGLLAFSVLREPVIRDTLPRIDSFKIVIDDYRCAGCWLGSLIGWQLERRLVRFETAGVSLGRRVLRGGLGALVMFVAVFPLFHWIERRLGKHWGGAAGMFAVQMYIMLVWPWVMERLPLLRVRERERAV
jgi:membrane-associated phospholipid phosphatase